MAGRILIVGGDGVDKRIDVLAVAIRAGMTVFDVQESELAYAPSYGSEKDPVNMAGSAAANILDGTAKLKHYSELEQDDFVPDVRTPSECAGECERENTKDQSNAIELKCHSTSRKIDESVLGGYEKWS
ncbi:MAG: hypothetical protein ACYTEK_12105 [Planctomycetota bacterium]|jgi:hypothetical protein